MSPPPGSPSTPARRHQGSLDQATWLARAAFDSAARAGDAARMAAVFAEDALLISQDGDSIRGREAIARYLVQLVPTATAADFSFGRDDWQPCRGSAREYLSYAAHVTSERQEPAHVLGKLVVFWERDSTGDVHVAWVSISRPNDRRRLRPPQCPSVEDSIWRSWRVAISVFPVAAAAASQPQQAFENRLRAFGWVDECICRDQFGVPTPVSKWNGRLPPGLVGIEYHLRLHVIAEVLGGRLPGGSTVGALYYSSRDYAQTRLFYSGAFLGALVSYDQWGVQIGLGPVVQIAQWRLRDSVIPYSSGGYPSHTDLTWSTLPVGLLGDARFHRLIGSRLFLAVRAQVRRFRKGQTPATPRFPATRVDQGSSFIGVGWGVVF